MSKPMPLDLKEWMRVHGLIISVGSDYMRTALLSTEEPVLESVYIVLDGFEHLGVRLNELGDDDNVSVKDRRELIKEEQPIFKPGQGNVFR